MVEHSPNPTAVQTEQSFTQETRSASPSIAPSSSISNIVGGQKRGSSIPNLNFLDASNDHAEGTMAGNGIDDAYLAHALPSHISKLISNPPASSIIEYEKQLNDLRKKQLWVLGYVHRVIQEIQSSIKRGLAQLEHCEKGATVDSVNKRFTQTTWREETIDDLLELFKQYQRGLAASSTTETFDFKTADAFLKKAERSFKECIKFQKVRPIRRSNGTLSRPERALLDILEFLSYTFEKTPNLRSSYLFESIYQPLEALESIVIEIRENFRLAETVRENDIKTSFLGDDITLSQLETSEASGYVVSALDAGESGLLSPPASPKEGISPLKEPGDNDKNGSKRTYGNRDSGAFSPPRHVRARSSSPSKGNKEETPTKEVNFDDRNRALGVLRDDKATTVSSFAHYHDSNGASHVSDGSRHSDEAQSISRRRLDRSAEPRSASQETIRPSQDDERRLSRRVPSPPPRYSQLIGDKDNRVHYLGAEERTFTLSMGHTTPFWKRLLYKDSIKAEITVYAPRR